MKNQETRNARMKPATQHNHVSFQIARWVNPQTCAESGVPVLYRMSNGLLRTLCASAAFIGTYNASECIRHIAAFTCKTTLSVGGT